MKQNEFSWAKMLLFGLGCVEALFYFGNKEFITGGIVKPFINLLYNLSGQHAPVWPVVNAGTISAVFIVVGGLLATSEIRKNMKTFRRARMEYLTKQAGVSVEAMQRQGRTAGYLCYIASFFLICTFLQSAQEDKTNKPLFAMACICFLTAHFVFIDLPNALDQQRDPA